MGQALHGSARPTEAIRRAIPHSQAGVRVLAWRTMGSTRTKRSFCPLPITRDISPSGASRRLSRATRDALASPAPFC
jgi:hypothetical protein